MVCCQSIVSNEIDGGVTYFMIYLCLCYDIMMGCMKIYKYKYT